MNAHRKGITVAGNILNDVVKQIDRYPGIGMLSNISKVSRAVGGCVPNTGINLAKIDPTLDLSAAGKTGQDEAARYVLGELQKYGIDTARIVSTPDAPTGFSDVMSLPSGERTFFHARGANALFSPADVDIDRLDCALFHIGYILLLDAFDAPDAAYGTVMARFLHDLQARGIRTSVDCVSDSRGGYADKMLPAMKYADYVIVNEIESCGIFGVDPYREDGSIQVSVIEDTMRKMMQCGVREKVIVHCKEAGFCLSADGTFTAVPSYRIPPEEIMGSCGAGDAFCAGCLCGIYHGFSDREILEFASGSAACNLFADNAVDGMQPMDQIRKLSERYERLPMPR